MNGCLRCLKKKTPLISPFYAAAQLTQLRKSSTMFKSSAKAGFCHGKSHHVTWMMTGPHWKLPYEGFLSHRAIGVLPNHPCLDGIFSFEPAIFWVPPIYGTPISFKILVTCGDVHESMGCGRSHRLPVLQKPSPHASLHKFLLLGL